MENYNHIRRSSRIANRELRLKCPLCRLPSNDAMVLCDKCEIWHHHTCVGLTESSARAIPKWFCNNCHSVLNSTNAMQNSMFFDPIGASSTMFSAANNQTIIRNPNFQDPKASVYRPNESSFRSGWLEKEKTSIEKEIEDTIRQLEESLKIANSSKQKVIVNSPKPPKQINSNVALDKFNTMGTNDNNPPNRMQLLKEKERLVKMHIDIITEQLKQSDESLVSNDDAQSINRLASPSKQFKMNQHVFYDGSHISQQSKRVNSVSNFVLNATSDHPHKSKFTQLRYENPDNSKSNESEINVTQWMARQTVQPLPIFDGRPEDWQMFKSAFDRTTKLCKFSDDENLDRLQNSLKGVARELVQGQFFLPKCVAGIMKDLEMAFGRPDQMMHVYLQKIKNAPSPHSDKPESIIQFATSVKNLRAMMEASNMRAHLNNPQMLQDLVSKLPMSLKYQWASYILDKDYYDVETFTNWLDMLVRKTTLVMPTISIYAKNNKPEQNLQFDKRRKEKERIHVQDVKSSEVTASCYACGGTCENLSDCRIFIDNNNDGRWKILRDNGICKQCLKRHPFNRGYKCKSWVKCTVENCVGRHHPLMHRQMEESLSSENVLSSYTQRFNTEKPMLRYIPVILSNGKNKIREYAFLDEGSTGTMLEQELAEQLNLSGVKSTLFVEYTAGCHHTETSILIDNVSISGDFEGAKCVNLKNVQTVKKLGLECQTLDYMEIAAQFNYMKYLPIQSYNDVRPRLLIGLNNWACAVPNKVRYENNNSPMAAKCLLGWSVFAGGSSISKSRVNYQVTENFDIIRNMVKKGLSIDGLGVKVPKDDIASQEDRSAMELLKFTTRKVGEKYQTGLLWKHPEIKLPDNSEMALKRLHSLEYRMSRQPEFAKAFREQIKTNIDLGYIRKLSEKELEEHHERVWYLPLLAVQNPNKPGRVRVVYDAAAKSNGISLNSVLMKGPDPITSLLGVLIKFRKHKVGISGDITHMFSQVMMRPEDQHAQRFYWRDDSSKFPDVYVLQVMSFGAACSPATAMYVKNLNAEKFRDKYPRAVQSIIENHYVDDMLDGMDDEHDTVQLAEQVKFIHSKAGFNIGKWKSNSAKVMTTLERDVNEQDQLNMNFDEGMTEKVLGMFWDLKSDSFFYSMRFNKGVTEVLNGKRRPTKREILTILMSIYDPLGLIAHVLAYLKVLIQDVWKTGSNWDEQINDSQNERWMKWLEVLPRLEDIRVPRCYLCSLENWNETEIQLHTMVDASLDCAAAVSFFRITRRGQTVVSLVGAKTKVAPLKSMSVPRLELTAALIGARLANSISESVNFKISQFIFWSDSKTVLCWLRSDAKKLKGQFITFRISEIQDSTNVSDWRYVPSRLNIADDATKWVGPLKVCDTDRWFTGPSFLYEREEYWPEDITLGLKTKIEIKVESILQHNFIPPSIKFERFSNWKRLLRATAYVIRFCYNLLAKVRSKDMLITSGYLTSEELARAEKLIFQTIQMGCYSSEIKSLSREETQNAYVNVDINSKIYHLTPVLVDGLIRVKGRTGAVMNVDMPKLPGGHVSLNAVRPIILPPDHYGTRLLVRSYHENYRHLHHETVVNEMRQLYCITKLRQVLKKVVRSCSRCKLLTSKPMPPQMADLPQCRLMPYTRPFTYVGIDCMGPMDVSVGRRREKRWICLFTCLTVRAIHLEVLHRMDHDSFILIFRSFTQERGHPKEVFSDNGTNFVKAEKVLREDLLTVNFKKVAEYFESPTMKWNFNPPSSPHMGGSWERLVKSVKSAFYSVPHLKPLNDQLLHSYIKEIQNIVNSRPLTYLPLSSDEDSALTPNHFLRGDSSGCHPIGRFSDDVKVLKWNWEMSQMYANNFWRRWVIEYMPELTRRSKWWSKTEPLKPNDVVLIVDSSLSRNCWPRGKIESVHSSKDGQVRSAVVKTQTGFLTRPATKLAKLDLDNCALICEQTHQDTGLKM